MTLATIPKRSPSLKEVDQVCVSGGLADRQILSS